MMVGSPIVWSHHLAAVMGQRVAPKAFSGFFTLVPSLCGSLQFSSRKGLLES